MCSWFDWHKHIGSNHSRLSFGRPCYSCSCCIHNRQTQTPSRLSTSLELLSRNLQTHLTDEYLSQVDSLLYQKRSLNFNDELSDKNKNLIWFLLFNASFVLFLTIFDLFSFFYFYFINFSYIFLCYFRIFSSFKNKQTKQIK